MEERKIVEYLEIANGIQIVWKSHQFRDIIIMCKREAQW